MRGLKVSIDYLRSFYPVALVPETLKKLAGCTIMSTTLAHSLRRAVRQGQVRVVYIRDSKGVKIAHYKAYARRGKK